MSACCTPVSDNICITTGLKVIFSLLQIELIESFRLIIKNICTDCVTGGVSFASIYT